MLRSHHESAWTLGEPTVAASPVPPNVQMDHRGITEGSERDQRGITEGSERDQRGITEGSQRDHGGITEGSRRDHRGIMEGSRRDHGGIQKDVEAALLAFHDAFDRSVVCASLHAVDLPEILHRDFLF